MVDSWYTRGMTPPKSKLTLDTPITTCTLARYHAPLEALGIRTVGDLIHYYPRRYEDLSTHASIDTLMADTKVTITATIEQISEKRIFRPRMMTILEATLSDVTGTTRAVWFNQPWLKKSLQEGSVYRFSGLVKASKKDLYLASPAMENAEKVAVHTGKLIAVYGETTGITSKYFRHQIPKFLELFPTLPDPLPSTTLESLHLPTHHAMLRALHIPDDAEATERARKRLSFEQCFYLQLRALSLKSENMLLQAPIIPMAAQLLKSFTDGLPFDLTDGQRKSSYQILQDMERGTPMNRLLNGDVGSGKTLVATLVSISVVAAGYQVALLAPTEVLARQHGITLQNMLSQNVGLKDAPLRVGVLTKDYASIAGQEVKKKEFLGILAVGGVDIVVGTHALIQDTVEFHKLGLVVVDEQHRFGVNQRGKLLSGSRSLHDGMRGLVPHFLTMTATPIPRTLALSFFGHLDVSLLTEVPKHKKSIKTEVALSATARKAMYTHILHEVRDGRQAFIVTPLVEDSETIGMKHLKAATAEYERLQKEVFPNLKLGLLHGRMKPSEKDAVMQAFKSKKIDILVATQVIEVGIDVPNATIVVIEAAERFGLSQLHQLRGRVGRGEHASTCYLVPSGDTPSETQRLRAMMKTQSGFDLAEIDLKLRGPGGFIGTSQSGFDEISSENLMNVKLIAYAREAATQVLEKDPKLKKHPLLHQQLRAMNQSVHFE